MYVHVTPSLCGLRMYMWLTMCVYIEVYLVLYESIYVVGNSVTCAQLTLLVQYIARSNNSYIPTIACN